MKIYWYGSYVSLDLNFICMLFCCNCELGKFIVCFGIINYRMWIWIWLYDY